MAASSKIRSCFWGAWLLLPDAADNELIFFFGQIIYQKVKNLYQALGA
jgi:hypothetical protein